MGFGLALGAVQKQTQLVTQSGREGAPGFLPFFAFGSPALTEALHLRRSSRSGLLYCGKPLFLREIPRSERGTSRTHEKRYSATVGRWHHRCNVTVDKRDGVSACVIDRSLASETSGRVSTACAPAQDDERCKDESPDSKSSTEMFHKQLFHEQNV